MSIDIKASVRNFISLSLIFAGAGTLSWQRGWIFVTLSVFYILFNYFLLLKRNPDLIKHRRNPETFNSRKFDRVILPIYIFNQFAIFHFAAGLSYRYGAIDIPENYIAFGIVIYLTGMIPISWSMAANRFLEVTVRIQYDKNHEVVSSGPYGFIRHPMYLGLIILCLADPFILGSSYLFILSLISCLLLVLRTYLEDKTLLAELKGYDDYASKVRYRLLPFIF
ncbi:MAG: isoprenylcysteine carboxylmethyltransferase family protein [Oligoflexales bacterium]|nr:isoprenylcysteine carboxylmethyltransferase family protein [Oligoflexales bacterium]